MLKFSTCKVASARELEHVVTHLTLTSEILPIIITFLMAAPSIFSQMPSSDPPEPLSDDEAPSSRFSNSNTAMPASNLDALADAASSRNTERLRVATSFSESTNQQLGENLPGLAWSSVLGRHTREDELEWSPRTKARLQEYTTDKCAEYGIPMDDRADLIEQSTVSLLQYNTNFHHSDHTSYSFPPINS